MSDQNFNQFVPPPPPMAPPPEPAKVEGPVMSTGQTLTGIFFEPGNTFASFRNKPRFLVALLISLLAIMIFFVSYTERIGFARIGREAIEKSPRAESMTAEQKEQQLKYSTGTVAKIVTYVITPFAIVLITGLGAAIYLLGGLMMGGRMNYWQALGVWVYSSFPPIIISTVLNMVLLFIMNPDTYDIVRGQRRGLVQANLGFLVNAKDSPQIATLLGSFDLIAIYGLFLVALGLRKAGKLSAGAAWAVVLVLFIIGVIVRVGGSLFTGAM
jgi:hypothetical protein